MQTNIKCMPYIMTAFDRFQFKQECIPVGCLPSTIVAVSEGVVYLRGMSAYRVTGVSAYGGVYQRLCQLGGVST